MRTDTDTATSTRYSSNEAVRAADLASWRRRTPRRARLGSRTPSRQRRVLRTASTRIRVGTASVGQPVRIVCVAGARPNFMKIAPVLEALETRGADTTFVHTGQHYDAALSDVFLDELGIRQPDHHLDVGSGSPRDPNRQGDGCVRGGARRDRALSGGAGRRRQLEPRLRHRGGQGWRLGRSRRSRFA